MGHACRDYRCLSAPDESGRASLTQARIHARVPVIVRVILRVNARQIFMGRGVPIGVAVVAGLVDEAVVDIHARRSEKEDRQREKSEHAKAGAAHHSEKLAGWHVETRIGT